MGATCAWCLGALALGLFLSCGAGCSNDESAANSPASFYRGNLQRTGVYEGPGPRGPPSLRWKFETESCKGSYFRGVGLPPIIRGGVAYFADLGGTFYALQSKTGKELWRFRSGLGLTSSPAYDNGLLFAGGLAKTGGEFLAMSADTGEVIWRFHEKDMYPTLPTQALAVAGRVFFGNSQGSFYALDAASGRVVWRFAIHGSKNSITDQGPAGIRSASAVSGSTICFGADDGNLYAVDMKSGKEVWSFRTEGSIIGNAAIVGQTVVFLSCDTHLYALDVVTGKLRWKRKTDPGLVCTGSVPAVADGVVYVLGDDGQTARTSIFAIDLGTGEEKWCKKFEGGPLANASLSIADGAVHWGTREGLLYAMDLKTGKERWRFQTESRREISSCPVIADGMIFFGSLDGCLYVLE